MGHLHILRQGKNLLLESCRVVEWIDKDYTDSMWQRYSLNWSLLRKSPMICLISIQEGSPWLKNDDGFFLIILGSWTLLRPRTTELPRKSHICTYTQILTCDIRRLLNFPTVSPWGTMVRIPVLDVFLMTWKGFLHSIIFAWKNSLQNGMYEMTKFYKKNVRIFLPMQKRIWKLALVQVGCTGESSEL